MASKCPKCGAEASELPARARVLIPEIVAAFACGSRLVDDGEVLRTKQCERIRELTAENERLRKEVEDYRKGAAAEAAAGDEAREELANARDFIATSPTGQQRCYKCNQWIFSYPCMYCGR